MVRGSSVGLLFHAFTPAKIADITHADTNVHQLDISAYVPASCVLILLSVIRESGTGDFRVYPYSGVQEIQYPASGISSVHAYMIFPISDQEIEYDLTVANDAFDLWLWGYLTQYGV